MVDEESLLIEDFDHLFSEDEKQLPLRTGIVDCVEVVRKKRARRPRVVPLAPRLLKNDIRRQYALMFTNVMNAADLDLLVSFLSRYSTQSPRLRSEYTQSESTQESFRSVLDGKDVIACYMMLSRQMMPDQVMRLHDVRVKTRSDCMQCELCCDISLKMTVIHDHPHEQIVQRVTHLLAALGGSLSEITATKHAKKRVKTSSSSLSPSSSSCSLSSADDAQCEEKERDTHEAVLQQLDPHAAYRDLDGRYQPVLSTPIPLSIRGVLTIVIDEHKRIEEMRYSLRD